MIFDKKAFPKVDLKNEGPTMLGPENRSRHDYNWNSLRFWGYKTVSLLSILLSDLDKKNSIQNSKIQDLIDRYKNQTIENTNNTEVVDARKPEGRPAFHDVGERLDKDIYTKANIDKALNYDPLEDGLVQDYNVPGAASAIQAFSKTIAADKGVMKILFLTDIHAGKGTNDAHFSANNPAGDYNDATPLSLSMVRSMNVFDGLVDCIVVNGDNIHGHEFSADTMRNKQIIKAVHNVFSNTDNFITLGNHDDGSVYSQKKDDVLSREDLLDIYDYDAYSFGETRQDFAAYKDYTDYKIRVLSIAGFDNPDVFDENGVAKYPRGSHSVFRQDQIDFIIKALQSLPDGYAVIVFNHSPLAGFFNNKPYTSDYDINHDVVNGVFQAFVNKTTYTGQGTNADFPASVEVDFSGATGSLIGIIAGHEHRDQPVQEINGVKSVTRTAFVAADRGTDKTKTTKETLGTLEQYAFDVIEIDTKNRKVNFKRFGIGDDYSYGY